MFEVGQSLSLENLNEPVEALGLSENLSFATFDDALKAYLWRLNSLVSWKIGISSFKALIPTILESIQEFIYGYVLSLVMSCLA